MKSVLLVAILAFGLNSFAHNHEGAPGIEKKEEILKHIDEKIAKLQEHRTCVSAANDKDALKKCHESMKEFRHEKRDEWKDKKEQWKEKRKGKKE